MTLELHQALGHFTTDLSREESTKPTNPRSGVASLAWGARTIATFNTMFALHRDTPLRALLTRR